MSNLHAIAKKAFALIFVGTIGLLALSSVAMAQQACINMTLAPTAVDAAEYGMNSSAAASSGAGLDLVQIANSTVANLPNGDYQAWCGTHYNDPVNSGSLTAASYTASTDGTGIDNSINQLQYTPTMVSEINYILNNKIGTVIDVQEAIWLVASQVLTNPPAIPAGDASADATTMYNAAVANGQTFVPVGGQRIAVFLVPIGASPSAPAQNLIIEMTACGQIGDRVWFDSNSNGVQDYTIGVYPNTPIPQAQYSEPGINGVTVQLKDQNGNLLATTVTGPSPASYPYLEPGSAGWYQFTGLVPGNSYQVFIDNTQSSLSGYAPTLTQQGSDVTADSNSNPYTDTLAAINPAIDETVDFGYITATAQPLSIACAATTGEVGAAYSSSFNVTGGVSPYTFSIANGALPTGLTLNTTTGALTGTPTAAGPFSFTVQVVDSSGTSNNTKTASCGITIQPSLSLTCASATTGQVGVAYSSSLAASGGVGPYTYSIPTGSLPAGLTLNTSTGAITGTPTAYGTFSFTAQVTDSSGLSASNTKTSSCSITIAPPPVVVTCPYSTGTVNIAYTSAATATGGTGTYTWSVTSGMLPAGLTLNISTGAISGTPTTAGIYAVTIQAKDTQNDIGTANCSITINAPPLNVSCASTTQATLNSPMTASSVLATGGSGSGYSYSISNGALPTGVTLNSSSGVISGTPTASGTFSYTVKVTDSKSNSVTTNCSMTVMAPPLSLTCGINTALVGTAYSSGVSVGGGQGPYTYAVQSGALPPGLTLNTSTGVISGTPTTAGPYSFMVQVTDSNKNVQSSSCTITVTAPVKVTCISSVGQVGQSYVSTFAVTGGTGPYTFSISSGSLPSGLTLNTSTGAVTGVPTTSGTFSFTVKAVDSTKSTAGTGTSNCSVVVSSAPPTIDLECGSCGSNKTTVGQAYSETLSVNGAKAPYTYSILSGSLPPGLALNASTGVISGTATTAGTYTFTSKVVDANTSTDTATCTITVVGVPLKLQCGTCGNNSGNTGTVYSSALSATGGTGTLTYSIASGSSLPPGLTLNPTTGVISGTPASGGTYTFKSTVTDQAADTSSATCTITIQNPPINLQCGSCGSSNAYTGTSYSSTLQVNGGRASYTYSIASGSLPPGLTLNSSTGSISGTPTTPGTYTFTSKVVDANGLTDTATCTINVQGQPINLLCGTCGNSTAKVGASYSSTLSVTGGKANFTYSIISGSLPPGLTLNPSTGVISGAPASSGTYNFTSKVVDANGDSDTASCTITVTGQASINLDCGTCGASKASVGVAYSAQYSVTGGSGSGYTYSIISGSLPPGLSLNSSTGAISGTPANSGTYNFTAKAVDSRGNTDTQACTVVVAANPVNLDCGACGQSYVSVGVAYTANESLAGGVAPYSISLLSGQLPPGLTVNSSTGVISGTPTTPGSYTFTTKVVDHTGGTDTATCTIVVVSTPVNLQCGACGNSKVYTGNAYSSQLSATGGSGTYTYSIGYGSLPPGLTVNSSTGVISGTPTTAGTYTFTSRAQDTNGKSDTATCTIVVTGSPITLNCGTCGATKATVGTAYSAPISQSGGSGSFSYSIGNGSLPPGLTLNASTGAISGTPTASGSFTFTLSVTDSSHASASTTCTIDVSNVTLSLQCGTCGQNKTSVGSSYSVTLSVTGGTGGNSFSIVNGSLPPGLSLNTSTGVISGKATGAGSYTFTTQVTDSGGKTDTATCSIIVAGGSSCGQYVTYTQGDWGTAPSGSNCGQLLQTCWGSVYSSGYLQIGGSNELKFTSCGAIDTFLPSGGSAGWLSGSGTNPSSCSGGQFAGEVLALQLNCDFSSKGVTPGGFSNLHVCSGPWTGQTVAQVLSLANAVLGGATWQLPQGLQVSDLSNLCNAINGNFENGQVNCGVLQ